MTNSNNIYDILKVFISWEYNNVTKNKVSKSGCTQWLDEMDKFAVNDKNVRHSLSTKRAAKRSKIEFANRGGKSTVQRFPRVQTVIFLIILFFAISEFFMNRVTEWPCVRNFNLLARIN